MGLPREQLSRPHIGGPRFNAYASSPNVTVADGADGKLAFDVELYDNYSAFALPSDFIVPLTGVYSLMTSVGGTLTLGGGSNWARMDLRIRRDVGNAGTDIQTWGAGFAYTEIDGVPFAVQAAAQLYAEAGDALYAWVRAESDKDRDFVFTDAASIFSGHFVP